MAILAKPAKETKAICPACKAIQDGLKIVDGVLCAGNIKVTGYHCYQCGRTVHWGIRRGKQQ